MKKTCFGNNKVIKNIFSLLSLRGMEYIVAFVTLPYLLRVLGPEKYGAINFAQVVINYGVLVVDYGFNLTAPRDIAKATENNIAHHFMSIIISKLLLFIICLSAGVLLLVVFNNDLDYKLLACTIPIMLGNVIFPVWYFQGIQDMRFITIFNLMARIISVIGIFVFVNTKEDYYLAALLQSVVPLLAGSIALPMLWIDRPYLFCKVSIEQVKNKLLDGWDIFISTLFINLYTNSNILILGIMTNDTVVGYYAAANKLIEAVKGLMTPVSNAIFPHVTVLFGESKEAAQRFLCRILHLMGMVTFVISLCVCIFAEQIVAIVMGNSYGESIILLRVISFLPFIICLSNIFGIQTMVAFGMQGTFSRILMASAALNLILIVPMIYMFSSMGIAITVVIVETFVAVTMYVVLLNNHIVLK